MILSNEDRTTILSLLHREVATLNDDGGACKRLMELFENSPDTEYVYMVAVERACYGLWTDPHKAVKWLLDTGNYYGEGKSLNDAFKEMSSWDGLDGKGYVYLHKIPINPAKPWHMEK